MAKKVKDATKSNALPDVYLVCEGDADETILASLTQKILRRNHTDLRVAIVAAQGKQPIPRLVEALADETQGMSRVGIVIDSDGQVEETRSFLGKNLDLKNYFVVIANPSVESWLGDEIKGLARNGQSSRVVDELDLDEIEREHPEVAILSENLKRKAA